MWVVSSNQEAGDGYSGILLMMDEGTEHILKYKGCQAGKEGNHAEGYV